MHPSHTVLVACDDSLYAEIYVSLVLDQFPHAGVRLAPSLQAAETAVSADAARYHMIILDLEGSAVEDRLVAKIRSVRHLRDTPIMLVSTALDYPGPTLAGTTAVFLFVKPFRAQHFSDMLSLCHTLHTPTQATLPSAAADEAVERLVDRGHMNIYLGTNPLVHRAAARQFFNLAPGRLAQLQHTSTRGDWAGFDRTLAVLQQHALTLGAHEVAKLAKRLSLVPDGLLPQDQAHALISQIISCVRSYCNALPAEFAFDPDA